MWPKTQAVHQCNLEVASGLSTILHCIHCIHTILHWVGPGTPTDDEVGHNGNEFENSWPIVSGCIAL